MYKTGEKKKLFKANFSKKSVTLVKKKIKETKQPQQKQKTPNTLWNRGQLKSKYKILNEEVVTAW